MIRHLPVLHFQVVHFQSPHVSVSLALHGDEVTTPLMVLVRQRLQMLKLAYRHLMTSYSSLSASVTAAKHAIHVLL